MKKIEFDEVFLADLKDDFELAGKGEREFSIYNFIGKDLSRAFGVGYGVKDWGLWVPVTARKELRHMTDGMEKYDPQLQWVSSKWVEESSELSEYIDFVLSNMFFDNEEDMIKVAVLLGNTIREKRNEKV